MLGCDLDLMLWLDWKLEFSSDMHFIQYQPKYWNNVKVQAFYADLWKKNLNTEIQFKDFLFGLKRFK